MSAILIFFVCFKLQWTVVNGKHLFALLHPEQSNSRFHKQFRENLVHEMVQPHRDEKANPVLAVNPNENRLKKLALLVGRRKMLRADNQEKNWPILKKCDQFICKDCFRQYHTKSNLK